jgi:hypothetical protein
VALAAAVLAAAASRAMGLPIRPDVLGLAFAGTLVVYGVDRLRDLPRDRLTSPDRAAFVARHHRLLSVVTAAAGVVAVACGLRIGLRAVGVAALVMAVGLLHRRLKRLAFAKALYISAAWVAVVVGVPLAASPGSLPRSPLATAACLGLAILANAIASNVRDDEAGAAQVGPERALRAARGVAVLGLLAGLLAEPGARGLIAVPTATLAALIGFRPTERYGLVAVDGALIAGGLAALLLGGG